MPSDDDQTIYCNARRSGNGHLEKRQPGPHAGDGYCGQPAGHGTDHTGEGRCSRHGGTDNGRRVQHGLYSSRREELREKIAEAKGKDAPGSMWDEVAVLRALLAEFLDRLDEVDTNAIDGAAKLQSEIRRTINTAHKMMHRDAPSEEEVERLITGFANILESYVPEADRSDAIDELETIVGDDRRPALESGR